MTLVWDIPANCPFNIHPAEADIPPLGSSQFTLSFRPTIEDHYYLNMLEGYCYYKNQRSFRLVKPDDFTPPHRVQVLFFVLIKLRVVPGCWTHICVSSIYS